MKKIKVIVVLLFLASCVKLVAQETKTSKVERLQTELNLTDFQTEKLKIVFRETRGQIKGIRQNASMLTREKRIHIKGAREVCESKIMSILTTDQYAQFSALKASKKARKNENKLNMKEAYLDELGATEKQKAELKIIRERFIDDVNKIKNDPDLTDEHKQEQVKVYRAISNASVKKVLTKEQYHILKAKKKEARKLKKVKEYLE
jgi:Spy/CpxP family protein refolding chaperone